MANKKILIVGSFRPIALESIYAYNLEKVGHEVMRLETFIGFHDNTETLTGKILHRLNAGNIRRKINKEVVKYFKKTQPDVVMFFKGADIYTSTLAEIKKSGVPLINYNPDHPLFFERQNVESQNIEKNIAQFDLYLSYSTRIVESLKNEHQVNAAWLPFGYDDRVQPAYEPEFIDRDSYLFVGAWDPHRNRFLSEVPEEYDLKIYGGNDWQLRNPFGNRIKQAFQNSYLVGADYGKFARNSAGVINLLREQNLRESSHNMRTFEVPGYGGFLFSQGTEEQKSFFDEDNEVVFFDSNEELSEKIAFYSKHNHLVEKIKKAALEKSIGGKYSYYERAKQLSDLINSNC